MSKLPIIIVGAGGHAAVVADALLASGETVLGFTDSDPVKHGGTLCGLPVLGADDDVLRGRDVDHLLLANGIGGVRTDGVRRKVQRRLEALGWRFASVRHPRSVVSAHATLAPGTQVLAGAIVQAGAGLGEGCIANTAAVIEHDTLLGEFVHVAPGAVVCGEVRIGEHSHVGAGAIVRQSLSLGPRTLVAAGAVVVSDFQGDGTLIGLPARSTGH